MEWHHAVNLILPRVVRIATPSGYGTGFMRPSRSEGWTNIITAAHVVAKADSWGESIRLSHDSLDAPVLLPPDKRLITVVNPPSDLAIIGVLKSDFEPAPPPEDPIKVIPAGRVL